MWEGLQDWKNLTAEKRKMEGDENTPHVKATNQGLY